MPFLRKLILVFLLGVVGFGAGAGATVYYFRHGSGLGYALQGSLMPEVDLYKSLAPSDAPYTLLFAGDIMMDRGIKAMVEKYGAGDYHFPFEYIKSVIAGADIAFANLEGPIADVGTNHGSSYSFRMGPAVAGVLADSGFDIVSFANNHVGDYGREAFEDTLRRLVRANISYAGAGWDSKEAMSVKMVERNGHTLGFLGFSDVGPKWMEAGERQSGIAIATVQAVTDAVRQASLRADILIVSFHFGDEYHVLSNSRQKELAHAAVDAGAKIVIGHHPHVVEDTEWYKDGFIAYSLGNFVFDQAFSDNTKRGCIVRITMKGRDIERVEPVDIVFDKYFRPVVKE